MTAREAILSGTKEAARLHQQLDSERELRDSRAPVNVFSALLQCDTIVIFRPLEGLLGACLSSPARGVIISTQRPLSVQRFTGAHELGHVVMHHTFSADGEEILQSANSLSAVAEIQANAFASAFLIPYWLLVIHAKAQGWDRDSLKNPVVVYQLSLRIGASFEATAIALKTHKLIDEHALSRLRTIQPKSIKQELLPNYQPSNWYRDVWLLTEKDENVVLEGQPDDIFLFRLNEKSGAGYLWDADDLKEQGFAIVRDSRDTNVAEQVIGADVKREVSAMVEEPRRGEVLLAQKRPWQRLGMPAGELHVRYDLRGKEVGLPRLFRQRQLEAA